MKYKIFLTIFAGLIVMATSVSGIYHHFFETERLNLIKLNLVQNAEVLKNSNLDLTKVEFSNLGKEYIERIIGDDKVNIIVGIYNLDGALLFKNKNAYIFNLPDIIDVNFKEWEDVEDSDYIIKYLTVADDEQQRIIKVGMILNQSLIRWKYLNQQITKYVIIVLLFVSLGSFLLTKILFRPVSKLSKNIKLMSEKIEKGDFKELSTWFKSSQKKHQFFNDEYSTLLNSLDELAERITLNQHLMQKWTALMAHELKTPMTRLKNAVEGYAKLKKEQYVQCIENELEILEAIIMDFLDWASLENDESRQDIHAVSAIPKLNEIVGRFRQENPSIIFEMEINSELEGRVFCNPLHFNQLVINLIANSIKYSGNSKIQISLDNNVLMIRDFGPGINTTIIENIGRPFNRDYSSGVQGHGLGLAWVKTICRKYNWTFQITNENGALIRIIFNDSESISS